VALLAIAQQGIAAGEIDPALDARAVVLAYDGCIHALKLECVAFGDDATMLEPTALAEMLVTIFERGIRAAPR
jgi:predicted DNA-binding transcriptional regulator YafY